MLSLLVGLCGVAAEVVHVYPNRPWVAISHDPKTPWENGDHICIYRGNDDGACGEVVYVNAKLAVSELTYYKHYEDKTQKISKEQTYIELGFNTFLPELGDPVRLLSKNPKKGIQELVRELGSSKEFGGESLVKAPVTESIALDPYREPKSLSTFGLNFTSFFLQYQQSITQHSAIGIRPIYLHQNIGDGKTNGIGGFITYDYYSTDEFRGVWFEGALGLYRLKASNAGRTEDFYAPALNATLGWRLAWQDKVSFGFGVGAQYLLAGNFRTLGLDFTGFLPSVVFDFGFRF